MEVASKWPWKVSAALVPISFVTCYLIARAFTPPTDLAALGPNVIRQAVHAFATHLQYVLPAIFLVAAVVSFVRRSRSAKLLDVRTDATANVSTLSWQDFECLVGEGFRHRGFAVTERGGAGPDGGVDVHGGLGRRRTEVRYLIKVCNLRAPQTSTFGPT
jgi:restriction system protein